MQNFDGTVGCPQANLFLRQISGASGCFDSNQQTPEQACFTALCAPAGIESVDYPFNVITTPGLCRITSASSSIPSDGECAPVAGVDNSGDRFNDCLDCTQNGRECAEGVTLGDGSRLCTSLTPYTDNATARYVDLSLVSGLKSCRNDSMTLPGSQLGERIAIEFPFMQLRGVTANVAQGNNSACGVRTLTAPLTAAYSLTSGAAGSLAMAGQTTAPLTLAGGFATIGQLCFGEICQTELSKLRLVLGDFAFAGFTLRNTQIETTRPRILSGSAIPTAGGSFEVAVDIAGMGRAQDYITNASVLTVTRTQSTIRLTGSFNYLARTSGTCQRE